MGLSETAQTQRLQRTLLFIDYAPQPWSEQLTRHISTSLSLALNTHHVFLAFSPFSSCLTFGPFSLNTHINISRWIVFLRHFYIIPPLLFQLNVNIVQAMEEAVKKDKGKRLTKGINLNCIYVICL